MNPKLNILIARTREKGIKYGIERMVSFLLRPFTTLILRNRLLIEFFYGILPKARDLIPFYLPSSGLVKYPQGDLIQTVRKFWYSNHPGDFELEGEKISRQAIFIYGGPNPKFVCHVCQKSEWLSRIHQKNLFAPHNCPQAEECQILCSHQGDELWTHHHQNFDFSIGCNSDLPAPKGLVMISGKGHQEQFFNPQVGVTSLVRRRCFAYAAQIEEGAGKPRHIDWSKYDFLFITTATGICIQKFSRPNIPIIMYGHDWWPLENKHFQWMTDWLKPDIFLTICPTPWKERCTFAPSTKVAFYPLFDSTFFARPNLGEKKLDLLVIGATTSSSVYEGRIALNKKISKLTPYYQIEFSHLAGAGNVIRKSSVFGTDSRSGLPMRFLNKWSEYLGSAKYVIFGKMKYPALTMKHYEVLGSGAIPIFPEVPDLKFLNIKPFQHYIPLSEVEGDNQKLAYYLDHYEDYKYIAQDAVKWYKENSDKMLFNNFEDLIREVTANKYPKRLI